MTADHINRAAQTLSLAPWADLSITEQVRWLNAAGRLAEAGLLASPERDAAVAAKALREAGMLTGATLSTEDQPVGTYLVDRDGDGIEDESAPADDLPGEPVEPRDLRAEDRVTFTYVGERITGTLASAFGGVALRSDTPNSNGYRPSVVWDGEWHGGISDVRLIERAPREDEDPDEAHPMPCNACYGSGSAEIQKQVAEDVDRLRAERDDAIRERDITIEQRDFARATRDDLTPRAIHAEAERDEWREVAARYADGRDKWQAEARQQRDRAEKAEGVCAILEDRVKFWQEEKRIDNEAERSYLARAEKAEAEAQEFSDWHDDACVERDAANAEVKHLRGRLDALLEDVERGARHWSTFASSDPYRQLTARAAGEDLTAYLARDDERAAKGGAAMSEAPTPCPDCGADPDAEGCPYSSSCPCETCGAATNCDGVC